MPQELPGFYYDAEKNRYFANKSPNFISSLLLLLHQLVRSAHKSSIVPTQIKLYDHRMVQRGAVQSCEGNVNSHSRIQLGVDPSEKFVMSGGEDSKLRIWSIKSGELLFEEKFTDSVPSVVYWQRNKGDGCRDYEHTSHGAAWLGSQDGLIRMRWS